MLAKAPIQLKDSGFSLQGGDFGWKPLARQAEKAKHIHLGFRVRG